MCDGDSEEFSENPIIDGVDMPFYEKLEVITNEKNYASPRIRLLSLEAPKITHLNLTFRLCLSNFSKNLPIPLRPYLSPPSTTQTHNKNLPNQDPSGFQTSLTPPSVT